MKLINVGGSKGVHEAGRGGFFPFFPRPAPLRVAKIAPVAATVFTEAASLRGMQGRFFWVQVLRVLEGDRS
jgi:hypothetical protein